MKWYIGQEIVCTKTHSEGVVKKGETFHIKGLQTSHCKCGVIEIDVGVRKNILPFCGVCGYTQHTPSHIWWFHELLFAPLDFDISELTDILEQPKELIKKQYENIN